ncbi:NAD-dependent epimerase/dehydratase family protein [Arthrobacter sp. Soc17.1.1.1]|uniref:NAD-dependent epimerase/dehydratase family protein n=1 Tax=Arthrobacter sp. Soc17.1.1.1 TaxID=3121277 RepID=UPI002FE4A41C
MTLGTIDAPDAVWVVGAGGLLGQGVVRRCAALSIPVFRTSIPWDRPDDAVASLAVAAQHWLKGTRRRWTIIWCAGAGVTSTSGEALETELDVLRRTLATVAHEVRDRDLEGRFFLASSAGGLYAGAEGPPFDETTEPQPLAPYGHAKLRAESLVRQFCQDTSSKGVIGRFSNLYGPGQNLNKAQGLISVLVKSVVTGLPVKLYVSLDTLRDYLYVDDAAKLVLDALDRVDRPDVPAGSSTVKVMASQRADSISALVGVTKTVLKRRALLTLGASPYAKAQALDLRMRSVVWSEIDRFSKTPLPVGINTTALDMRARYMSGALSDMAGMSENGK